MRKNEDCIAVYSRKSKFTGKGESVQNQEELTKQMQYYKAGEPSRL